MRQGYILAEAMRWAILIVVEGMIAAMREARLEPPRFHDTHNHFRVTFKNATMLNPEALAWLNQFAGHPLNDNQRLAPVYLRENEQLTVCQRCTQVRPLLAAAQSPAPARSAHPVGHVSGRPVGQDDP